MSSRLNMKSVAGVALVVLASVFVIYGTIMCWVLRDGMGPDSIESHGATAFARFLEEVWLVVVIGFALGSFGIWLTRKKKEPIQLPETTRGK